MPLASSLRENYNMASISSATGPLGEFGSMKFDFDAMEKYAGADVTARFKAALVDGTKTSSEDGKALEGALYEWCSAHGCINYAHWCVSKTVVLSWW